MEPMIFQDKRILITGGTGSLGQVLLRRLLSGERGKPEQIIIFSRDEAKQYALRAEYQMSPQRDLFNKVVKFVIGDVRDFQSIAAVVQQSDVVFNTAALKQVPTCEYYPAEASRTNIQGAENIVRAIELGPLAPEVVVGISTDKACKPVNVMGMTKAVQERIFLSGNLRAPWTRFVCVRYGNVLASRGSVIPLFQEQLKKGGPLTVTAPDMTRFLLSLDDAVDLVFAAVETAKAGETYIPRVPAAFIMDVAAALIGDREDIEIKLTGVRPGEKIHEVLVSEEEAFRTTERGPYYVIASNLPELKPLASGGLTKEYCSNYDVLSYAGVVELLRKNGFIA